MRILIDIGGSAVRIRKMIGGELCDNEYSFEQPKVKVLEDFYGCILHAAQDGNHSGCIDIDSIAISLAGEYDYLTDTVMSCFWYKSLIGKLKDNLIKRFKCRHVNIVNDGDAHVLALKEIYARGNKNPNLGSAINLALGTSVGLGVLDWRGRLLHTCEGHNWESSPWQIDTHEKNKSIYWALGSKGLKKLEEDFHGSHQAYVIFGQRLCHFLGQDLIPFFHPRVIGLSGGIIVGHAKDIEEGIRLEREIKKYVRPDGRSWFDGVEFYFSSVNDSVMLGLEKL